MTTYTWIGVSGPWTAASFWTVDGAANGAFPEAGDDAIISAAGTYTVTALGAQAENLTVSDPDATLESTGPVGIVGTTYIPGLLTVVSTDNAGTIVITGDAAMVSGTGTFVNSGLIIVNGGTGGTEAGTLEVEGEYSTANLGSIENTAGGQIILRGTLDNAGSVFDASGYAAPAGGLQFDQTTILGGTLDFGTYDVPITAGLLDGVTVRGDLTGGAVVEGGLTVYSAQGTFPGTVSLYYNALIFADTETLDNVNVLLGSGGAVSAEAGQTLTLGVHASIDATDPGFGPNIAGNAVILEGTISTSGTGEFAVDPDSFANNGVMQAAGDELLVESTTVSNAGAIIAANGGTVRFETALAGGGTIGMSVGSTVECDGLYGQQSFAFGGTGNLLRLDVIDGFSSMQHFAAGDTIEVVGTPVSAAFADGTLTIEAGTQTLGGFIMTGVPSTAQFSAMVGAGNSTFITDTVPATTYTWRGGSGLWTDDTLWAVNGAGNGGFPGSGAADTAIIAAAGAYTIDLATAVNVQNLAVGDADATVGVNEPLGVAAATTNAGTLYIGDGTPFSSGTGELANSGSIALGAGASLSAGGTFTDSGTISLGNAATLTAVNAFVLAGSAVVTLGSGAFLEIGGSFTAAQLEGVTGSGGTVAISGTIDNAGGTLNAAGFAAFQFNGVSITGGTLELGTAPGLLQGALTGVTVLGVLNPDAVVQALTLGPASAGRPGSIDLTAYGNRIEFGDSELLDNVAISMGSNPWSGNMAIDAGQTLTLGPLARLTALAGTAGGSINGSATPDNSGLICQGTIDALASLSVSVAGFGNGGLLEGEGANVTINTNTLFNQGEIDAGISSGFSITAASFFSSGTVLADGGNIFATGSFANTGTVRAHAGTFADGDGSNTNTMLADGGAITFAGNSFGNTGTITSENDGLVIISNTLSGAGTIGLAAGGTVELGDSYAGQAFAFTGTGNLLQVAVLGGANAAEGFLPGDTIETVLPSDVPIAVQFTGGTLAIEAVQSGTTIVGDFLMPDQPGNAQFTATPDPTLTNVTYVTETIPCFAAGARLLTDGGEAPVERLRVGDRMVGLSSRLAQIVWIGRHRLDCGRDPRALHVLPVRIEAHAFGPHRPHRDLLVSPDHAVFVDGALIPVRYLINGCTIMREPVAEVRYYHVELAAHDVMLAEGLPCESYLDTGNRAAFGGSLERQPAQEFAGVGDAADVGFYDFAVESVARAVADRGAIDDQRPVCR